MFCVYCGTANPDDALFCRSCGKRQPVATSNQETDASNSPESLLQRTLIEGERTPVDNAPIEQGNPSTFASPLEESSSHSVGNFVPPTSPPEESDSQPAPALLTTNIRKYHNGGSRLQLVPVGVAVALVAVVVVSVFLSSAGSRYANPSGTGNSHTSSNQ